MQFVHVEFVARGFASLDHCCADPWIRVNLLRSILMQSLIFTFQGETQILKYKKVINF
jgi:hypothetical protein